MEKKIPGKINSKIWGCPFFLEILENAVPFAIRSCRKFKLDLLVEFKALRKFPFSSDSAYAPLLPYTAGERD